MITLDQLMNSYPDTDDSVLKDFVDPINKAIDKFEITNVAQFLAQMGHESSELKTLKENLNYSADGLNNTFSKYFNDVDTADYAHHPEKIANLVYANRMGNGDEDSGDGWRFHGRGAIQCTGKSIYDKFANYMGMSLDEVINYLETPEGAVMSAGWYWKTNNVNRAGDDVRAATRIVNGGTNGLSDRQKLFDNATNALK